MPKEFRIARPSGPSKEYMALAHEKAGPGESSRYVVSSTEQVLEVHDHVLNRKLGARISSIITRPREPKPRTFASTAVRYDYSQIGIVDTPLGATFFSNSGTALVGLRRTLVTEEGEPLCYPRLGLLIDGTPTYEVIQQEIALMREVGKNERIIYRSLFPSHRGKTRNEIHNRPSHS
jgi:hypothetical protein